LEGFQTLTWVVDPGIVYDNEMLHPILVLFFFDFFVFEKFSEFLKNFQKQKIKKKIKNIKKNKTKIGCSISWS